MAEISACHPIWLTYSYKNTERLSEGGLVKDTGAIRLEILEDADKVTQKDAKLIIQQHEKLSECTCDEVTQRAFWIYYYEVLHQAKDTDGDRINDQDIQFFYKVFEDYNSLTKLKRNRYSKTAARNAAAQRAPVLPDT